MEIILTFGLISTVAVFGGLRVLIDVANFSFTKTRITKNIIGFLGSISVGLIGFSSAVILFDVLIKLNAGPFVLLGVIPFLGGGLLNFFFYRSQWRALFQLAARARLKPPP